MVCTASTVHASEMSVHFGPLPQGHPEGLDEQVIRLIRGAEQSIEIAAYELRIDNITQALARAQERGVQVRIVTDDSHFDSRYIRSLIEAGIEVRHDGNRDALMHDKFLIADGEVVATGSFNFTNTGAYNNQNNLVVFWDRELARIFSQEFEKLFEGNFYRDEADEGSHHVVLDLPDRQVAVEVFFQPRNRSSLNRMLDLIDEADQAVYMMQFAFFNSKVGKLLGQKHRRGEDIRAVIDYSMVYGDKQPYSQVSSLARQRIPFSISSDPDGKLHHKVFVIDPDQDDGFVITGSANASSAGYKHNVENIVVIRDPQTARTYRDEALRLLARRSTGTASIKPQLLRGTSTPHTLELTIRSGGRQLQDLEISLPFFWSMDSLNDISAVRGDGKNLSSRIRLSERLPSRYSKVPVQEIHIDGADLAAAGPGSRLTLRLQDIGMSRQTRPGRYCFYVRGTDYRGQLAALPSLPTVKLYRSAADDVASLAEFLQSRKSRSSHQLRFVIRDLAKSIEKELDAGRTSSLEELVQVFEEQGASLHRYRSTVQPFLKRLDKKIRFAATHSPKRRKQHIRVLAKRLKAMHI